MKLILIYNPESEIERNTFNRLKQELSNYIIREYDYREVRDIIPIRATPAFVVLRDDLEGVELLEGDAELKITAEAYKIMQEEELKVHQKGTYRLDNFVKAEKQKAEDNLLEDMLSRGLI